MSQALDLFEFMKGMTKAHAESSFKDTELVRCLELARRLRDESFDSKEEFRECLNALCDALSLKVES